jgi:hypothetical protein
LLLLVLAATSAVLGWVGLQATVADNPDLADAGVLDIAYFTGQLFVLSSEPVAGTGPYPATLELARFLAPLTTALAVLEAIYALVRGRVGDWRTSRRRGHSIVTGDTDVAWALALRLAEDRPVVLVTTDSSRRPPASSQLRVVTGDIEGEATLRAAGIAGATALYACSERGARNVGVGLLARRLTRSPLVVLARSTDAELVTALRARRVSKNRPEGGFRLDFFAVEGLAARALVDEYRPFRQSADTPVTVVGSGPFGQAAILELADRVPADWSGRIRWVVGCVDEASSFLDRFGHGTRIGLSTELDVVDPGGLVIVCHEDSDEALRVGLAEVRRGATATVIICLPVRSAIAEALEPEAVFDDLDGRLSVFGILDAACEPLRVESDLVDQLARALHQHYVEACRANGDTPHTNPSMVAWEQLPQRLKESNYEQADHIGVKLDAIDAVIVPALDGLAPFELQPSEVEQLAELEHDRWMRSQLAIGVVLGSARVPGVTHPDLKPWDDLDEPAREKDRTFIRALPELLASKRLAILRLSAPPSTGSDRHGATQT